MWYKEHHWNFSVLQRIHLSNFVMFMVLKLWHHTLWHRAAQAQIFCQPAQVYSCFLKLKWLQWQKDLFEIRMKEFFISDDPEQRSNNIHTKLGMTEPFSKTHNLSVFTPPPMLCCTTLLFPILLLHLNVCFG
jgi:hypothetical protein